MSRIRKRPATVVPILVSGSLKARLAAPRMIDVVTVAPEAGMLNGN